MYNYDIQSSGVNFPINLDIYIYIIHQKRSAGYQSVLKDNLLLNTLPGGEHIPGCESIVLLSSHEAHSVTYFRRQKASEMNQH